MGSFVPPSRSLCLIFLLYSLSLDAEPWPQFHGPNASGVRSGDETGPPLPAELAPDKNVIWKIALPSGHSSPVVFGDRIYVTAVRGQTLLTMGINAKDGAILWETEAPHEKLEEIHRVGSYAQPSPATDGKIVVSFFGSSGLFCYDTDGKPLWSRRMGPFNDGYGAGSSPILAGDWVLLNEDHDTDSFLAAFDKRTGQPVWKSDRVEFPRGYSTPVIWDSGGKKQIVVAGTLRMNGYEFATGKEVWTVRGISRIANTTPVVGSDGILYLAIWAPGGDRSDHAEIAPFAEALAKGDKNQNGTLEPNEPADPQVRSRFSQFDRNKDGHINEAEYNSMREIFAGARNLALAVKPGGEGDITASHVLWTYDRMIPYVPSPVFYRGNLFMVKNGGIFSSLDAKTGQPSKQGRVSGQGDYFSSPVAGDGKIYLLSEDGDLTVVSAAPQWKELSHSSFGERAYSTPAIVDGKIYLRTSASLYCFGLGHP